MGNVSAAVGTMDRSIPWWWCVQQTAATWGAARHTHPCRFFRKSLTSLMLGSGEGELYESTPQDEVKPVEMAALATKKKPAAR